MSNKGFKEADIVWVGQPGVLSQLCVDGNCIYFKCDYGRTRKIGKV